MEKLFSVAGTSALEGVVKFRVANGSAAARTKVLVRSGHTDIKLVDLPVAMTKEDAIRFVDTSGTVDSTGIVASTISKIMEKSEKEFKRSLKDSFPKQKTVKTKPAKAKLEKAVRTINAAFKAKTTVEAPAEVTAQPDQRKQNIDEIAKIKAKNLETMRRVSNKLAALRSY